MKCLSKFFKDKRKKTVKEKCCIWSCCFKRTYSREDDIILEALNITKNVAKDQQEQINQLRKKIELASEEIIKRQPEGLNASINLSRG